MPHIIYGNLESLIEKIEGCAKICGKRLLKQFAKG